jgi:hypothetical protein
MVGSKINVIEQKLHEQNETVGHACWKYVTNVHISIISYQFKFANFGGLYFPHFETFRNQTLQFY